MPGQYRSTHSIIRYLSTAHRLGPKGGGGYLQGLLPLSLSLLPPSLPLPLAPSPPRTLLQGSLVQPGSTIRYVSTEEGIATYAISVSHVAEH
eukprot:2662027-Rhodomonas_salina.3